MCNVCIDGLSCFVASLNPQPPLQLNAALYRWMRRVLWTHAYSNVGLLVASSMRHRCSCLKMNCWMLSPMNNGRYKRLCRPYVHFFGGVTVRLTVIFFSLLSQPDNFDCFRFVSTFLASCPTLCPQDVPARCLLVSALIPPSNHCVQVCVCISDQYLLCGCIWLRVLLKK